MANGTLHLACGCFILLGNIGIQPLRNADQHVLIFHCHHHRFANKVIPLYAGRDSHATEQNGNFAFQLLERIFPPLRCFRFRCFLCWRFLLQHLMDALQQKLPLNRLRHIILRTKADCLPHQLIAVNRGNKNADTRKSPLFDVFQNP